MTEGVNGASFEVPGYRVRRRIGRGGFAVVYEAEQLSLGRAVALKMLMPEMATDRDLRRFERERLLLSELSRHRHVVDVIDAGTTADGHPFIVMGLYRRGSLAQALSDTGPMRPGDVVTLVGKLASALQAAHNRGVIHRDIKPENVLIADDGEPALADFGISVMTGPDRTTTGNFFTMAHVAPEVLQRGEYGIPSDVYALASTVYLLLAGRSAFRGDNQFAQMRAIVEDPVPPIGRADVPPGLEAVVVRGMAKDPQDRHPSAVAFADDLAAAWRTAQATPVSTLPGFPAPGPLTFPGPGPVPASAAETVLAGAPAGVATLFGPPESPAPPSEPLSVTSGDPQRRPGRSRRRGPVVAAVVIALALPALFGATYALDVPPGSALRGPAPVAVKPLVIGTAMSQQGFADGDNPTNTAVDLYLESLGHRVGDHSVALRRYDVATPRWTRWDSDTCVKVARQQVAESDVVGVVGPYNSGCAKLMLPILSGGAGGSGGTGEPVAVVSNGATDPGLTKSWDVGEPGKYYPNGVRNFARVVTTDDVQGRAAAIFAHGDLAVTKVFVVNDGAVYGKHIARAFADSAKAEGLTVVGEAQWKRGAKDYRALFAEAKKSGADAVFLGGAVANNGLQVVQDKVAVLGDNQTVKLLAADGFTGEPKLAALPEAQGMYLTFPGLSPVSIRQRGGAGSRFLDAFQEKYGHDPEDPYAIYGVAAAQVLVEAIRRSDGTRAGVRAALFTTPGVTVPKADSVLGADTRIDWETGDVSIKDVTVQVVKRNAETFETVVTVP